MSIEWPVRNASGTGLELVTGVITTKANLDIPLIDKKTLLDIMTGINGNSCKVMVGLVQQSKDIVLCADKSLEAKNGEVFDNLNIGAGN